MTLENVFENFGISEDLCQNPEIRDSPTTKYVVFIDLCWDSVSSFRFVDESDITSVIQESLVDMRMMGGDEESSVKVYDLDGNQYQYDQGLTVSNIRQY